MNVGYLVFVDRVTESLWQMINGIDDRGLEAHKAWLALPEPQRVEWRARANAAIADWKRLTDLLIQTKRHLLCRSATEGRG